ncbi:MAG: glycoside hydrolase family 127 protein [Armatimonadota bacterium]|nr:MAG: glycoside hydrolase family 127 protein [Armatimonadota bacterium]
MANNIAALEVTDARSWAFTAQGEYEGRADRRALFIITHPWAAAGAGDFGMIEREAMIPADWKPPYRVRFYCADDYVNDEWRPKADDWLGGEGFGGHRFKQVLVNGQVVWESDVADAEGPQVQTRFEVDLTPYCQPGEPFRLALRVLDKVGTATKLPQDFHHIGSTEAHVEKADDPARFMTHVYWGDLALLRGRVSAEALARFERRPSEDVVERVHAERRPLRPFGTARRGPAKLTLEMADAIPPTGFPVTCGVPLPAGRVTELDHIALRDPAGRLVPLQAARLNRWADGSVRWALLDFIAPAGAAAEPWRVHFGSKAGSAPTPAQVVRVRRSAGRVRIDTGLVAIAMSGERGRLMDSIAFAGSRRRVAGPLTGEIVARREGGDVRYVPEVAGVAVKARGPVRATVEATGRFVARDDADDALGRFVFRLHAYAGQPFARVFLRIFNDTDETLRITRFGLTLETRGEGAVWSGDCEPLAPGDEVAITQETADRFTVTQGAQEVGGGEHSQGWAAAAGDEAVVVVAVRRFWQLFPKSLRAAGGRTSVDLFAGGAEGGCYEPVPGEAKRHDVLLAFLPPDAARADAAGIVNAFARPPRLSSSEWFCSSGGLGHAAPHSASEFAELHAYQQQTYGEVGPTVLNGALGMRDFPDATGYTGNPEAWRNNYYDIMQGTLSEYLIGGDARWFDRGEDQCLHCMDVDTCHGRADHPEWLGVLYAPGANHTSSWWSAMLRAEGMDTYYRLSGDPDALAAFLGVADFIVRENAGIGSRSVRDHAGALITLTRAHDETGDAKYLAAARRLARDALSRIDARRGCYSEVHGNYNYRGNVPWMCAQLMEPLYLYYRQSGDVAAAKAVVGLAESIMEDNTGSEGPGDYLGYSHNPHYGKHSGYNVLIAPAVGYAWELTGDEAFAASMRDAYERTIAEKSVNWIANCYWNTPTLLYYLDRLRHGSAIP